MQGIKIVNPRLYEKIINAENTWKALFKDEMGTLEDERIPILAGGIDHIENQENCIVFHDRGCEKSGGWYSDNTFAICRR